MAILETLKVMCRNPDICLIIKKCTSLHIFLMEVILTPPLFTVKEHALNIQLYYDDLG